MTAESAGQVLKRVRPEGRTRGEEDICHVLSDDATHPIPVANPAASAGSEKRNRVWAIGPDVALEAGADARGDRYLRIRRRLRADAVDQRTVQPRTVRSVLSLRVVSH